MSVYKRGKKGTYWVRLWIDGEEIRRSARTSDKRTAEKYERELREDVGRIRRGGRPRRTWNEMMAEFVREHLPGMKQGARLRYVGSMKAMAPFFDGKNIDSITRGDINKFVTARRKQLTRHFTVVNGRRVYRHVSDSTIRRDLACLSSAYERAIGWGWVDQNPIKLLDKRNVKDAPPRTRYLTEEEFWRLHDAAADYIKPMLIFAVHTGLRREEQLSLTWDRVNWQRAEVYLPDTKTGTPRMVPLTAFNAVALETLRKLPRHISAPWVFAKPDGSRYLKVQKGIEGAVRRAGLKDVRWHDLRRTCGCWLLQSGVDIFTVSRWLGHKSVSQTERAYAFLDSNALHRAVQKPDQEYRNK